MGSFVAAAFWTPATSLVVIVLVAFGMGTVTPPLLTVIQNHLRSEQMGLATSSQQFFRQLGGAIGVSMIGFIMNALIRSQLAAVPGVSTLGDLQRALFKADTAPTGAAEALSHGLSAAFVVSALVGSIALYCAFNIPQFATARDASSEMPDPTTD